MTDYKNGKWAKKIIELQKDDGSWGFFHTLSMPTSSQPITTEQAIGRLRRLGFTKDDTVIKKAISYMHDCLARKKEIPDRPEKRADWGIFTDLMLAACIRRFTDDDALANNIADNWKAVADAVFINGEYDSKVYTNAFYDIIKPKSGTIKRNIELLRLNYYYPILLLAGKIEESIEKRYFDYIMNSETTYYYGHYGSIMQLPNNFQTKEASIYLAAIELYCEYPNMYCKNKLKFVIEWLNHNKTENGGWDMGAIVKNGTYFPLSDSWRTAELREKDCTYRIEKIISALET